jgi:hypothetical protein
LVVGNLWTPLCLPNQRRRKYAASLIKESVGIEGDDQRLGPWQDIL